ncbi:MAG: ABC transporter permease [bacterium]
MATPRWFIRGHDTDQTAAFSRRVQGGPSPEALVRHRRAGARHADPGHPGGASRWMVGFIATFCQLHRRALGATAGSGGRVDNLMMRFVDVMYGLPFMFLVILLMVIFQEMPAESKLYLLSSSRWALQWLTMSRTVRGQVISLKSREFIEAAHCIGVSKRTIILRHLIPNALGPIIVYSTLTVPAVMLEEAFLSFPGLGVQAPLCVMGIPRRRGGEGLQGVPLAQHPGFGPGHHPAGLELPGRRPARRPRSPGAQGLTSGQQPAGSP